jgi:hypothetical protein
MKQLQEQIGKEFYYVSCGGLSDNYMVDKETVDRVEVTEYGLIYKSGSRDYTKSGGKYGAKCFTDLAKAKEYAHQLNEKRYQHNKKLIDNDDRYSRSPISNPIEL